jgi:hypothetical protein
MRAMSAEILSDGDIDFFERSSTRGLGRALATRLDILDSWSGFFTSSH